MDPITVDVLVGLATNLIGSGLWEVARDPLFGNDHAPRLNEDPLADAISEARALVAPSLETVREDDREAVAHFLSSSEVAHIVGQVYRTRLMDRQAGLLTLRQAFAAIWGGRFKEHVHAIDAYQLFDALVQGCEGALIRATGDGVLSAHEAMSAARHRQVLDRLTSIERHVHVLQRADDAELSTLVKTEIELRERLAKAHSRIAPPNLRGEREIPIDDIFVSPSFVASGSDQMDLSDVVHHAHRLVVVGNPGAGKSTFARKLCRDLALRRATIDGAGQPIAVFLELRTYARDSLGRLTSIRDYLAEFLLGRYQLDIPPRTLEYLLSSGRLGIVFDGLDELPVISQRKDIREAVEAFAAVYPLAPVIVTSRLIGYEHAALDESSFFKAKLSDFGEDEVAEYVGRWFALDTTTSRGGDTNRTVEAFLTESRVAPDLRANPLMLGLMCVLYRGQGYIPRNRPDLYSQCATYLFETWDRHRGIEIASPFEALLRPAMRELALWIFTTPGLEDGVGYEAAVRRTTEFLVAQRYTDPVRAERAARTFIDFCRGRAWVFSDVGRDESDQDLFQFTHRTFLEFFAAEQLLDKTESTANLIRLLRPRILKGDWEVVAQLAVHIQQIRHLNSADRTVVDLLGQDLTGIRRERAVSFGVRLLGGLALLPQTVDAVTNATLDLLKDAYAKAIDGKVRDRQRLGRIRLLVADLLRCDAENRERILERVERTFKALLAEEDQAALWLGAELVTSGGAFAESELRLSIREQREWWVRAFDQSGGRLKHVLRKAAKADYFVALGATSAGWLSPIELLHAHGVVGLYSGDVSLLLDEVRPSIAERLFAGRDVLDGSALGQSLAELETPWLTRSQLSAELAGWAEIRFVETTSDNLAASVLLLCPAVEPIIDGPERADSWPGTRVLLDEDDEFEDVLADEDLPVPLHVRILNARWGLDDGDELYNELQSSGVVPPEVADRLRAWMNREIQLVSSD